ncbi:MAG TPA: hypothetical protein VJ124_06145 [Pyrinomonadaceae bacterium]|nr:hypothetical protein [Pyrinomonadaceae bacterium]
MKYCPKCSRTYSDDSLSFCLDDGTLLSRVKANPLDTNATLPYSSADVTSPPPVTEVIPPAAAPTLAAIPLKNELPRAPTTRSSNSVLTAAVITIALLLLVITGLGVIFLLRQKSSEQGVVQPNSNVNTITGTATASRSPVVTPSSQSLSGEEDLRQAKSPLRIKVTASSVRLSVQSNTYRPENVMDGTRKTAWIEGVDGSGVGEWLRFDFDRQINLHRILILPGYFKSPEIWRRNNRVSTATFNFSDGSSRLFNFPDLMERQSLDVGSVRTNWVQLKIDSIYPGTDPDTAISEIAFEWEP